MSQYDKYHNTNSKDFYFDSYSGTEMTVFLNVYTRGTDGVKERIRMGTLSAISGIVKTEAKPAFVLGRANPKTIAKGRRMITGQLTFEVIDDSFVEKLKSYLGVQARSFKLPQGTGEDDLTVTKSISDGDGGALYIDTLPPVDIVLVAVKENDPSKRAMKTIKGVKLLSQSGAVGMDVLVVQEQFNFIAQTIEALTDVSQLASAAVPPPPPEDPKPGEEKPGEEIIEEGGGE